MSSLINLLYIELQKCQHRAKQVQNSNFIIDIALHSKKKHLKDISLYELVRHAKKKHLKDIAVEEYT